MEYGQKGEKKSLRMSFMKKTQNNEVGLLWAERDWQGPSFRTGLDFKSKPRI